MTLDEEQLWQIWNEKRDHQTKARLVDHYKKWVIMEAKKLYFSIRPSNMELDDFIQHGMIATIDCIDRFLPEKKVNFRTYACHRIRGEILNHMEKYSDEQSISKKLRKMRATFDAQSFSGDLFEQVMNMVVGYTCDILYQEYYQSFYHQDEGLEVSRDREVIKDIIARAIERLTDMEKKVIELHYLYSLNFTHIADLMGVSKGRISQLYDSSIRKLNHYFLSKHKKSEFF